MIVLLYSLSLRLKMKNKCKTCHIYKKKALTTYTSQKKIVELLAYDAAI